MGKLANPWWLGGVALAVAGVILARIAAPSLDGATRSMVEVLGQLLALGGLCVIAFGVSRRVQREPYS